MIISKDQLVEVLSRFNPWWRGEQIPDLPFWQRAPFHELYDWVCNPPAPRAILLSGARQVGKTTLLRQVIHALLNERGVPAANILYATFDHPLIKTAGIDAVLEAWREREPKVLGEEYIFLDEAQFIPDVGVWVKHQVDFSKNRRIIFTGSAMPLMDSGQESGVGRWHTIRVATLSFYEYLELMTSNRQSEFLSLPELSTLDSLQSLFTWSRQEFYRISEIAEPYLGHFHQYLVRGGFPQIASVQSINLAQELLREDIIDKVLKRDMTEVFGVRRVIELEQTFLYLCMHDTGLLNIAQLCSNLGLQRPTVQHFIDLLETTHLIYRLRPFGYGKEILKSRFKTYLADPAISSAVLLKGTDILDNPQALGVATETAVFKHLFVRYCRQNVQFSYWQNNNKQEVDLIAETNNQKIPFEIKYRANKTGLQELKGLIEFCNKEESKYAYVITKSIKDFGLIEDNTLIKTKIMKIPAALLCYWSGKSEVSQTDFLG
jgi:predicted AAA+ superfamily ATPase